LRWHLSEFERPDHTILTTSDAWETDIEGQGHDPTRQDLEVERITPPDSIATRLNLNPKTDICVIRRHVRYIDGKPAIISDDYFNERIVRGTELAEPEDTTRETSSPKLAMSRSMTSTKSSPVCPRPSKSKDSAYRLARQWLNTSELASPPITVQSGSWCRSFQVTH